MCDPPAVCSSRRAAGDECSGLGPHLPLNSFPSLSTSAFPAVFLLWSLFSCFLFVVAFDKVKLYNRKRRSEQTNIQTLYVTECVGVCLNQPCSCVLIVVMAIYIICVIKYLSRGPGDSKNANYLFSSTLVLRLCYIAM